MNHDFLSAEIEKLAEALDFDDSKQTRRRALIDDEDILPIEKEYITINEFWLSFSDAKVGEEFFADLSFNVFLSITNTVAYYLLVLVFALFSLFYSPLVEYFDLFLSIEVRVFFCCVLIFASLVYIGAFCLPHFLVSKKIKLFYFHVIALVSSILGVLKSLVIVRTYSNYITNVFMAIHVVFLCFLFRGKYLLLFFVSVMDFACYIAIYLNINFFEIEFLAFLFFHSCLLFLFLTSTYTYEKYILKKYLIVRDIYKLHDNTRGIMDNIFPRYLTLQIKEKLAGKKIVIASTEKSVSILFLHLIDCVELMNKHGSPVVVLVLDMFYRILDNMTEKYGVDKMETVGSVYVACGGLPGTRFDHAVACILFSLRVLAICSSMKLSIKVGVHSGKVISGVVGLHRPQFALFGDTINTASRICSTALPNTVSCSEECASLLPSTLIYEPRYVEAKGKGTLKVFTVTMPLLRLNSQIGFEVVTDDLAVEHDSYSLEKVLGNFMDPISLKLLDNKAPSDSSSFDFSSHEIIEGYKHDIVSGIAKNDISSSVLKLLRSTSSLTSDLEMRSGTDSWKSQKGATDSWKSRNNKSTLSSGFLLPTFVGSEIDDTKGSNSTFTRTLTLKGLISPSLKDDVSESDKVVAVTSLNEIDSLEKLYENYRLSKISASSLFPFIFASIYWIIEFAIYLILHYVYCLGFYFSEKSYEFISSIIRVALIIYSIILLRMSYWSLYFSPDGTIYIFGYLVSKETFSYLKIFFFLLGVISNVVTEFIKNGIFDSIHADITYNMIFYISLMNDCGISFSYVIILTAIMCLFWTVLLVTTTNFYDEYFWILLFSIHSVLLLNGYITYMRESFYRRNFILQNLVNLENKLTDDFLSHMVPTKVAGQLKLGRHRSVIDSYHGVSILYADLKGFTKFCSDAPPSKVVSLLSDLFTAFDLLTVKHGNYKVETIGDGYVCVAGFDFVPQPTQSSPEKHAYNCVTLGLDFIRTVKKLRDGIFDIRIGIHTGNIVAGCIGLKKIRFDIWGEDSVIANLIESSSKPGYVRISETTKNFLNGKFITVPFDSVLLPGGGLMSTHLIQNLKDGDIIPPVDNEKFDAEDYILPLSPISRKISNAGRHSGNFFAGLLHDLPSDPPPVSPSLNCIPPTDFSNAD